METMTRNDALRPATMLQEADRKVTGDT